MRQTSRAVALLLAVESAQAALTANVPAIVNTGATAVSYYETVWMPTSSDAYAPTTTLQLNSRTAGYNGTQQVFEKTAVTNNTEWQVDQTNAYQSAQAGATKAASVPKAGSLCMACIGANSVWCSRTYSYLETASSTYQLENVTNTTTLGLLYVGGNTTPSTEAQLIGGAALDQGSCCGSNATFVLFVGDQATKADPTVITPAVGTGFIEMIDATCVAMQNPAYTVNSGASTAEWGVATIDDVLTTSAAKFTSWWCSNGLYKKAQVNDGTCTNGITDCNGVVNAQQLIGFGMNKRKELAMVGCPQKTSQCGNGASIVTAITEASTTIAAIDVATGAAGPTVNDKCTWVATGIAVAPTFYMSGTVAATSFGLATTNWQIHQMEYTSTAAGANYDQTNGSLQGSDNANQVGLVTSGSALQSGTFIPRFNMPAEQFATLRTWYGEAGALVDVDPISNLPASWLTPGQAPVNNASANSGYLAAVESQLYGNVVNVPQSTIATTTTASTASVGNTNYGNVNSIPFDLRVARYFPAKVAQTVWAAGSSQQALYVSSKSTYDAAKTMWDNYVALLEKNAKTDAFAALFSPPKAPTVPPMPNMPWKPNAYAGYLKATPEEQFNFLQSTRLGGYTAANAPSAQNFWTNLAAAQTVGGWGSFTAQILRFRTEWGKSFGTIGYSGDANKNAVSAVWNYKWTCGATANTTGPSTTSTCDQFYSQASNPSTGVWTTTKGDSTASTTILVSVVTLWSTSNNTMTSDVITPQYEWQYQSLSIQWVKGAWSTSLVSLATIAAPVAATAAKGLSGVAGAQALAATSAAALAVAAALY